MSTRILITGATGFIGRQLTRDLIVAGENVRILARDARRARALFGNDVEVSAGHLNDAASTEKACRRVDVLYHTGGIYRFGLRHRRELWRVNVEGTDRLFRSAAAARVGRVIHLSSGGLLKKNPTVNAFSDSVDENDFPVKAPRFSPYQFSKWHSELRAMSWARRGLPVMIASTTCPLGKGDEAPTPTGQMVLDFLKQRFPFYCRTALNFIDVRDVSRGLQEVARNGVKGRRYLLSHQNLWLKDFLDLLARETGLPAPRTCLPNWAIRLAGAGGEAVEFLNPHKTGARVCLETALHAEQGRFFDNTRTREDLDWKPERPIQESIRQAVAWFRHEAEMEIADTVPSPLESVIR